MTIREYVLSELDKAVEKLEHNLGEQLAQGNLFETERDHLVELTRKFIAEKMAARSVILKCDTDDQLRYRVELLNSWSSSPIKFSGVGALERMIEDTVQFSLQEYRSLDPNAKYFIFAEVTDKVQVPLPDTFWREVTLRLTPA
jgi:hypothetical protein